MSSSLLKYHRVDDVGGRCDSFMLLVSKCSSGFCAETGGGSGVEGKLDMSDRVRVDLEDGQGRSVLDFLSDGSPPGCIG